MPTAPPRDGLALRGRVWELSAAHASGRRRPESRDLEVARLRAQVAFLKRALAYADTESMRKRAESAAMEELTQCQRRVVQLHGYNQKLARVTEVLSKRLGLPTVQATGPPRVAQAIESSTPPTAMAESNIQRAQPSSRPCARGVVGQRTRRSKVDETAAFCRQVSSRHL